MFGLVTALLQSILCLQKKFNLYTCPDSKLTLSATLMSFFQILDVLSASLCNLRMVKFNLFGLKVLNNIYTLPQAPLLHLNQHSLILVRF